MLYAGRTFRIFVSSTFDDFKEERNALQEQVFPYLRELCMLKGTRFQAVDLRWGVSKEAAHAQQTMNICLQEIERSQATTPRPNFIILLGDRYGWRPLPTEIRSEDFGRLAHWLESQGQEGERRLAQLRNWYREDTNAIPSVHCLLPRTGEFAQDPKKAKKAEREILASLREAAEQLPVAPDERVKYGASATEQEITYGALRVKDADEHVHCFLRSIHNLPRHNLPREAQAFIDVDSSEEHWDGAASQQLDQLKERLRRRLPHTIHHYTVNWTGDGITVDHLGQLHDLSEAADQSSQSTNQPDQPGTIVQNFCQDVYDSLAQIIRQEIKSLEQHNSVTREILHHRDFGKERANPKFFTGREAVLNRIADYLNHGGEHPLAVFGVSGSGKTTLMARAVTEAGNQHDAAAVIVRFIGATPESSDGRTLLEGLCHEISRLYGANNEATVPTDYPKLIEEFPKRLARARPDKELFVFLDALDQLSDNNNSRNLSWLPQSLPKHVRIVVSTLSEPPCLPALKSFLPSDNLVELGLMPLQEGSILLDRWLEEARRCLEREQRDKVDTAFKQCQLPLFLKFAFEDARRWHSYDSVPELDTDIPQIIRTLFARLSMPANHGERLVERSLAYIAAGKNGLSEDELLEVLSKDAEIMADFRQRLPESPDVGKLPMIIWSRLYFDLQPYLNERSADGTSLLAFFHRQLREVVTMDYLAGGAKRERHCALALYFGKQMHIMENVGQQTLNLRKLSELPYQQREAEMWSDLENTLTDLSFIEAKCAAGMTYDLVADYNAALASENLPPERRSRIEDFARFLNTQSHLLAKHPALTFQQAFNEPDATAPAQAARQRIALGQETRLRLRWINKPQVPSLCVMTIAGHGDIINSCDTSPDGTRIVSASSDKSLKVWDAASGKELLTLRGHGASVETCSFSRDGTCILSGDRNGKIKIWDAASGQELVSLAGHNDAVTTCAFSPDGKRVVSASYDHTLKVWDADTGAELHTLRGHRGPVLACSFSPDGTVIVSGANDDSLRLWDAITGTKLKSLLGHENSVLKCTFSSDGKWIFSASEDGTLKRWDAATRKLLTTYRGHEMPVWACAISPDGTRLISASKDKTLKLWEVTTDRLIATLVGHMSDIWDVAFFPNGTRAVSASWDWTLKIWDVSTAASADAAEQAPTLQGERRSEPVVDESLREGPIISCNCSPGGTRFLVGASDGSLRLWDAKTGSRVGIYSIHQDYVLACLFSPDGKWILSGAWDGSLKLFDVEAQREGPTLRGHKGLINACGFSRDGARMVSCSAEKIQVWEVEAAGVQLKRTWRDKNKTLQACALAPDGEWVVVGTTDGNLSLWNVASKKKTRPFAVHEGFEWCGLSPDGQRLVSASGDGTLKVWDITNRTEIATLRGHTALVQSCYFSPDSHRIVSASWDHTVKLWDIDNPSNSVTLLGHTDQLQDACFSADGNKVLSVGMDGTFRLWDSRTGSQLGVLDSPSISVTSCAFSPNKDRIISASHRQAVRLWDGTNGTLRQVLSGHMGQIRACTFSPDGTRILSASADTTLKVWDAETGNILVTLTGHQGPVQTCAFSPDGKHIVSGAWDSMVRLWNAESGALQAILTGHTGWVEQVLFSRDGSRIFSCSQDRTVKIWDAASGQLLSTLNGHRDVVTTCASSPDETFRLVSGGGDGVLKIWDARTGQELFTLTGHTGAIRSCAFSPDGSQIISASMDRTLKLWDAHDGRLLFTLEGHEGWVLTCAFSPDGKYVLSGSEDQFLKLWEAATGKEICGYWTGAPIQTASWHPKASRLAVWDGDGQLHLLELE